MACRADVDLVVKQVIEKNVKNISSIENNFASVNFYFNKKDFEAINKLNTQWKEKVITYIPASYDLPASIRINISDNLYERYIKAIDIKRGKEYEKNKATEKVKPEVSEVYSRNSKLKTQYQLPQNRELEEFVVSEKTIRDLAARMSDRIGIPVRFESDRTKEYKGKIENNTAVINLAYATLDTPIHEILGHPIIRAIKNGKQVLDRYKNAKVEKTSSGWGIIGDYNQVFDEFLTKEAADEYLKNQQTDTSKNSKELYQNLLKELEYGKGKEVLDRIKRDYVRKDKIVKEYSPWGFIDTVLEKQGDYYTLEEQQEEAIVELLGLYTADRLDKVKDGKLISLLKRLLKEIKLFIKDLLKQKEVEIDKLPDNMTLGDIADLLAYSNSKLILPGNEVIYTTPDNQQFKTYQEASKHISDLAKSVESVGLSNISIENILPKSFTIGNYYISKQGNNYVIQDEEQNIIDTVDLNKAKELYKKSYEYQTNITKVESGILLDNNIQSFIEKNKEYEQSKEIIEEWKKVNNIQYDPEEVYSRGQEFVSVVGAYSDFDVNLMMQNLLQHIEDNEKAGGEFTISAFTKPVDRQIGHLEGGGGKIKFKIYPQSKDIKWAANTDVYSGSVWDASEKVSKDKKSELLGVSYTKYPSLRNVNSVQPNLASIIDDLAHHHNELGITLTGNNFRLEYDENIPYSTKKIIDSVNSILDQKYGKLKKPEIKTKNKQTYYTIERVSGYYDSDFSGVFSESEVKLKIKQLETEFKGNKYIAKVNTKVGIQPTQTNETLKESINTTRDKVIKDYTNFKTLSGNTLIFKEDGFENNKIGDIINYNNAKYKIVGEEKENSDFPAQWQLQLIEKEYTSQALINTKIAALKEVAKKYPRSLIRSEVKPIGVIPLSKQGFDLFETDELSFQKIRSEQTPKTTTQPIRQIKTGVTELFESNPELASIGTPEQYSQYLDTIFPDSKVKDIVYRNENKKKGSEFNVFKKGKENTLYDLGFYFTTKKGAEDIQFRNKMAAEEQGDEDLFDNKTFRYILNFKNPQTKSFKEYFEKNFEKSFKHYREDVNEAIKNNYDGLIATDVIDWSNEDQYIAFEPEQIHILGGTEDIEGFKNFVSTQPVTNVLKTNKQNLLTQLSFSLSELNSKINNFANKHFSGNVKTAEKHIAEALEKADAEQKELIIEKLKTCY